jgi:hypothetical protein
MDRVEKRPVSLEPIKKRPWFQGSQDFRVFREIRKLR